MDDVWVCVEDSTSSINSADSDYIDSEIEAELYGMIHHEDNLSLATNHPNDEDTMNNQTSELTDPVNNITNFIKSCRADINDKNSSTSNDSPFYQSSFKREAKNASTPLKRKSNSEQDSVNVVCSDESGPKNTNLISKQTSSNSNVDTKPSNNLPKMPNPSSKKKKVISDSSDSDDSVYWTERDSSVMKSDLKTNLFNDIDTIFISDSSDDEFVLSSPSRRNEISQKNVSLPNIKIGESSTDLWHINEEDLYRSRNKSRRYHNSDFQCNNCGQKGHRAKSCPVSKVIKCFICGGPHLGFECKNKICCKCYKCGHYYKQCKITSFDYCGHCSMKGHSRKDCPDIWRRYHLTTKSEIIVRGKKLIQDKPLFCFNCGWSGHHGAVCKKPRNCKGPLPTWPAVISYDNPYEFIDSQSCTPSSFTMDVQENQMQQPYERVKAERIEQPNKREKTEKMEQPYERMLQQPIKTEKMEQPYERMLQQPNKRVKTEKMEQPYERMLQQPYERRARSGKSKTKKKWEQFRQNKKLLREKDFPTSPIIKAEINHSQDAIPDCLRIAMKNQTEKRKKNRAKRWRRRQNNSSENIFKTKVSMYRSKDLYKK